MVWRKIFASLFTGFNICSYCCLYKWTAIVVREIIVKSDVFATWGWPLYLLCLPWVATSYKSLIVVNGGIFINRQHDVFFMHLRNVAAQKMWSHFTRFVFFSISLHSGPALFEAPSKRIIMAYPQCVHDHYIYFLGVVQLATRKKANRTTACPHKLTDFFL